MLCHYLNVAGERAFIVNHPPTQTTKNARSQYTPDNDFPGSFIAPCLTQDIIDFYDRQRLTAIVIYPEIFDNPLNAPFFGRYILNYPGSASLAKYSMVEDFSVAYSEILAEYVTRTYSDRDPVRDVLFVPAMDLTFWNRSGEALVRRGTCYYANKMRRVHGESPKNVPEDCIEILGPLQMSQADIRSYFLNSKAFYCFEDSALAIEAQLCGCPTIFVPNRLFDGTSLAARELGQDGSCIEGEAKGLDRAVATLDRVEERLRRHMANVPERIAKLGREWRALAERTEYKGTIHYPFQPKVVFLPKRGASNNTRGGALLEGRERALSVEVAFSLNYKTIRETARELWYNVTKRRSPPYNPAKVTDPLSTSMAIPPTPDSGSLPTAHRAGARYKRIAFFAHFDKDGIIDDHVLYYLENLRGVVDRILFMSDCDLIDGEASKLLGVAELICASRHGEYDFGSWKRGFEAIDYEFSGWDELVIANDSCYAPLFPFESAFDLVDDCDFWGASKEPYSRVAAAIAVTRAARTGLQKPTTVTTGSEDFEFINSYFMVFRKRILEDEHFIGFWRGVVGQSEKERVIELYEIGLTKLLVSLGYRHSAFAVRAGEVIYKVYSLPVPLEFQFPWLRVLLCKVNDELVNELDTELDRISYPRPLIDQHMRRMIGTAHPPHYYRRAYRSIFDKIGSWIARRLRASSRH